jgi:lysozyme family protein
LKQSYNASLAAVLKYEGGYVNHPKDPGGATNRGVTQATYNSYRTSKSLAPQSVRAISSQEVGDIYKSLYWDKVRGDDLPAGVDLAVFDLAVNSGVSRALRMLQECVGVTADGVVGPKTLDAVRASGNGLIDKLCDARLKFLQRLPTWPTFGKGWGNRVASVRVTAKGLT